MKNINNKKEPIIKNKNVLSYPSRTLDPPISIIDQVKEIEKAEEFIKNNLNSKLEVILNQIKNLKEEARIIIEKAYNDSLLHKVRCNFEKRPEEIIYLYENDNYLYFSRLSPKDWDYSPPHKYIGAYKMKIDRSFEKIE